jgi:signal transduction histidine kinase
MRGIFAKLTILQAACTLLVGVLLYTLMERNLSTKMQENFLAHGMTIVESLAQTIEPYLVNHDMTSVQSALDGALDKPSVFCAFVIAPGGQALAHTFVPQFPEYLKGIQVKPGHPRSELKHDGRQLTFFSQSVLTGIVGTVYIGMDRAPLYSSIHQMEAAVLLIIGVVMLGALLGFAIQARRIVAPVRALTESARRFGENWGGFEPLPIHSNDELGMLTRAFNGMAAEVRDHAENLEERVRERTTQLSAANAVLADEISQREQIERQLETAKDAAESASRAKSNFLANMSHEIRTPMNGVLGLTELVLGTDLDLEQREHLNIVKSSAESLLSVLNDILDFSKIEADRLDLESVEFDVRDVIHDALNSLNFRAEEKALELLCDIRDDVPEFVMGDPTRLRQILTNLSATP